MILFETRSNLSTPSSCGMFQGFVFHVPFSKYYWNSLVLKIFICNLLVLDSRPWLRLWLWLVMLFSIFFFFVILTFSFYICSFLVKAQLLLSFYYSSPIHNLCLPTQLFKSCSYIDHPSFHFSISRIYTLNSLRDLSRLW